MKKFDYLALLQLTSLNGYTEKEQIDIIGLLIDGGYSSQPSLLSIELAFKLSEQINPNELSPINHVLFHYFISNGWSNKFSLKKIDGQKIWDFSSEEFNKKIYHLRKSISLPAFKRLSQHRKCQIYTNLGASLNTVGRFIEAQEYFEKALSINPDFAMAWGNKGDGLFYYGQKLFNKRQQTIFFIHSVHCLNISLNLKDHLEQYAEDVFKRHFEYIKQFVPEKYHSTLPDLNDDSLNGSEKVHAYRAWILYNKLYLNPLNDIGLYTQACKDSLNLPNMFLAQDEPPTYIRLFNQIKQEFSTARFLYYEGTTALTPHYSDIDVSILETYEIIWNSYSIEQLKISFRMAYSILDKISYLLFLYFKIDVEENKVNFKTIWFDQKKVLRDIFAGSDNKSLRALFWVSKDLSNKETYFTEVIEPDAKEISIIRNHIEHKGFKVVSDSIPSPIPYNDKDISYSVSRTNFEAKTIKLLKLTRASIIYLSLAVYQEERKRGTKGVEMIEMPLNEVKHSDKL